VKIRAPSRARHRSSEFTPTHLDSHMGVLFSTNRSFFAMYVKVAHEYKFAFPGGPDS